jgi:hypothetical protein
MKPKFYYVYIIRSLKTPPHYYTGYTQDLDDRLNTTMPEPCRQQSRIARGNIKRALHLPRNSRHVILSGI